MKTTQPEKKWQTKLQAGARRLLDTFLENTEQSNLPHAFLFLGPKGVGKNKLANEFIQKVFVSLGIKPEILEYNFTDSPDIESLRELVSYSSLTSLGSKKIFVLRNFHLASTNSANSLLKTLEEPSRGSMFVLISDNNTALPTVMSRCIVVRCFPQSNSEQVSGLPENLQAALSGYPELAGDLIQNVELVPVLSEYLESLKSKDMSLIPKLADMEDADLKILIQLWIEHLKQKLQANINLALTVSNLRAAEQAKFDLSKNYNTKLVLQQFFIETKV